MTTAVVSTRSSAGLPTWLEADARELIARLTAAPALVDLVALGLDRHRCTVVVGPSV